MYTTSVASLVKDNGPFELLFRVCLQCFNRTELIYCVRTLLQLHKHKGLNTCFFKCQKVTFHYCHQAKWKKYQSAKNQSLIILPQKNRFSRAVPKKELQ